MLFMLSTCILYNFVIPVIYIAMVLIWNLLHNNLLVKLSNTSTIDTFCINFLYYIIFGILLSEIKCLICILFSCLFRLYLCNKVIEICLLSYIMLNIFPIINYLNYTFYATFTLLFIVLGLIEMGYDLGVWN